MSVSLPFLFSASRPFPITEAISSSHYSNLQRALIRGVCDASIQNNQCISTQKKTHFKQSTHQWAESLYGMIFFFSAFMILTTQLNSALIESLELKLHTSFTTPPDPSWVFSLCLWFLMGWIYSLLMTEKDTASCVALIKTIKWRRWNGFTHCWISPGRDQLKLMCVSSLIKGVFQELEFQTWHGIHI